MRIGIDARELAGHITGVGRYLAGLLREWTAETRAAPSSAAAHEFVLYAPEPLALPLDQRRVATRLIPGAKGTWWEQIQLPAVVSGDHLDVFFAPAYTAPLRLEVPTVVTIHDVSFVAHPEWFRLTEGARRRWLTRAAAARARTILTVSEFSKLEIVERLGVSESKVRVVPQGIDRPAPPRAERSAQGLDPRVLYVGSIFNRRRIPDLIRAVAALSRRR